MMDSPFSDQKRKIETQYNASRDLSMEYEKIFSRYLVVGSGAAIAFILTSYRGSSDGVQVLGKFDIALWLFTFSIIGSAFNVYVAMFVASRYSSNFLYILGMIAENEMILADPNITKHDIDRILKEFGEKWKIVSKTTVPFQRLLSSMRIICALSFAVGLIYSIYIVTNLHG